MTRLLLLFFLLIGLTLNAQLYFTTGAGFTVDHTYNTLSHVEVRGDGTYFSGNTGQTLSGYWTSPVDATGVLSSLYLYGLMTTAPSSLFLITLYDSSFNSATLGGSWVDLASGYAALNGNLNNLNLSDIFAIDIGGIGNEPIDGMISRLGGGLSEGAPNPPSINLEDEYFLIENSLFTLDASDKVTSESGTLTYQWYLPNGTPYPDNLGGNTSILNLSGEESNAGLWSLEVTDDGGTTSHNLNLIYLENADIGGSNFNTDYYDVAKSDDYNIDSTVYSGGLVFEDGPYAADSDDELNRVAFKNGFLVYVYERDTLNQWSLIGSPIPKKSTDPNVKINDVAISGDGTKLLIVEINYNGKHSYNGSASVYKYVDGEWVQHGQSINQIHDHDLMRIGHINYTGDSIVLGSEWANNRNSANRVFEYDNALEEWSLSRTISTNTNNSNHAAVRAMSDDNSFIAIDGREECEIWHNDQLIFQEDPVFIAMANDGKHLITRSNLDLKFYEFDANENTFNLTDTIGLENETIIGGFSPDTKFFYISDYTKESFEIYSIDQNDSISHYSTISNESEQLVGTYYGRDSKISNEGTFVFLSLETSIKSLANSEVMPTEAESANGLFLVPVDSPPILSLNTLYEPNAGEIITIDPNPRGYPNEFSFQWYFKGIDSDNFFAIPPNFGGSAANYEVLANESNNGTWKVTVSNETGSTSEEFEYRVFTDEDGDGLSDYREINILNTNPSLADTDSDGLNDKLDAFPNDSSEIQQDSNIIGEGNYQITPPRLDNIETNWNAYGQEFIAENEVLYGFKFYLDASLLTNKTFNLNLYSINDTVNPITSVNFEATDGDWLTIYLNHPINLELGEKYLFLVSPVQPPNDTWRMALSSSRNESTYEELNCTTRSIVDGVLNEQRSDGRDLFFDIIYEKDSDFDGITDNDELNIHNTNPLLKDSDNDGLDDFAEIYRFRVIWNEELYSWHECRDDALLKGGHLATFSNLSEWLVAREQLIANDVVHQGYPEKRNTVWLGGTDEISEGNWQWVTDEPFDYQLWAKWSHAPNEPDNYGGGVYVDVDYMSIQHHTYTYNEVFRAWENHPAQGPQSNVNTRDLPHAYLLEDSTDPSNSDTDGDGLSDGDELNVYSTNPNLLDTDGDSLSDFDELNVYSTNPNLSDTDGDGLSDGEEIEGFSTYHIVNEYVSWHDARDLAIESGGHLVVISSQKEWHKIYELISGTGVESYWLGATDEITEGIWEWVTGEDWSFTNWHTGEPNNEIASHKQNGENYLSTWSSNNHEWNDSNNTTKAYIIEFINDPLDPNNADTDSDGLIDGDELNIHSTNPNLSDTDGDGLSDGDELNIHSTNPNLSDTDGDSLSDGDELNIHSTNPNLSDTDGDGTNDSIDKHNGFNDYDLDVYLANKGYMIISEIQDLRPGSSMIQISNNQATIQLQMEESSDLQTWEDTGTPATMTIPADTDTKFFRFKMAE